MQDLAAKTDPIFGWWRLVSIYFEFEDNHQRVDLYGSTPAGFVVITPDRRMMGMLMSGDRASPASDSDKVKLFDSMMCYSGKVRMDDGTWSTTVDASWHPDWIGTEQVRHYKIEGGVMSVTTAIITHPKYPGRSGKAVVKWHRV